VTAGTMLYLWRTKGRRVCTITVPATTANLACGFDAFGAGFEMRMRVRVEAAPQQKATSFTYEGEGANEVALDESCARRSMPPPKRYPS